MANKKTNQYIPDYIVPPGEVLKDYLESLGMTQAELAARTGLTKKTINEIIKGKSPITHETALKFERALGRPAHFWNNLERQFQEDRIRLAEQQRLESYLDWLKKVPVNAMTKLGWIAKHKDKTRQLEEVLRFFGVASPKQWQEVWHNYQVAYRQTQCLKTSAESVSAWLRRGEIEALEIKCAPFNRKRFLKILDDVRDLTRKSPNIFVPELVNLAASAGVAVVFVHELPKTGVFGATRWLKGKAVLQLSLRYKSNDHLWFTFFHEAGHILKHGRKEIFIEGNGLDGEKEEEANAFARDKLIPPVAYRRFLSTWDGRSLEPIRRFAEEINVAPGIIVGRLQFEERLPRSHGNKLKVFYRWSQAS
ncbi:MAG: addiction module antidote protein, HigA family [Deltaproteobacteria bacterium]|nr:MAG: addiction module antidote protein, HigA family [Deltaproteobacteria bacterium]